MLNNRLVITLGASWQIVPELLGFTNPKLKVYKNHSNLIEIQKLRNEYKIQPVDEVWVITTGGIKTQNSIEALKNWNKNYNFDLKIFRLGEVDELATVEECRFMADYIYRTVLHASEKVNKLYLSLAGGRKTMSADMQKAGGIFGCDAMLHVVTKSITTRDDFTALTKHKFDSELPNFLIDYIIPLVTFDKIERDMVLNTTPQIIAQNYPLSNDGRLLNNLYDEINKRSKNAINLLFNYSQELLGTTELSNFRALYSLPPVLIEKLKTTPITYDIAKKLPKAELHCHFGGIANPKEMIEIAKSNAIEVKKILHENLSFAEWLKQVRQLVVSNDMKQLLELVPNVETIRKEKFTDIHEPFTVAGFLMQFDGFSDMLDKFIYGELNDELFKGIDIRKYESLGDLQGSGLLQSENSIRKASQILVSQCKEHNVKYIEVRCSPHNYTRGGLCAEKVVELMMDEFEKSTTYFNLIFIASRHGKMSNVHKHIELAKDMLKSNEKFRGFFAGFDLAGAEDAKSAEELRSAFLSIMEECSNITIHAGETKEVESIWEAVYHLNADRIGHGLKLKDSSKLMDKFKNRKITLEMCPTSNDQIVGFNKNYPLIYYLNNGIRVTINTDNPGISKTNFSQEFVKLNEISYRDLTQWEAIQLIKNALSASFSSFDVRQKFTLLAEKDILNIFN